MGGPGFCSCSARSPRRGEGKQRDFKRLQGTNLLIFHSAAGEQSHSALAKRTEAGRRWGGSGSEGGRKSPPGESRVREASGPSGAASLARLQIGRLGDMALGRPHPPPFRSPGPGPPPPLQAALLRQGNFSWNREERTVGGRFPAGLPQAAPTSGPQAGLVWPGHCGKGFRREQGAGPEWPPPRAIVQGFHVRGPINYPNPPI